MFAKNALITLMLGLPLMISCAPPQISALDKSASQFTGAELWKVCKGHDGWSDPAPPAHVFGNVYVVGTCGIVSLLITSKQGHILIDGATEKAAPSIAENIRKLGFDPKDVRYLLSSHEHIDHVGGLATLKNITGAQMIARAEAKAALESGKAEPDDPQYGSLTAFPGVKVDRLIVDGDQVKLGDLTLTAIATPGHSPGGTSWTWRSCEGPVCRSFVYADSLSAVSADGYRFSDHPEYVKTFKATIAKIAALTACDILITPHPGASRFFERLSGAPSLAGTGFCMNYTDDALGRLETRLMSEAGN